LPSPPSHLIKESSRSRIVSLAMAVQAQRLAQAFPYDLHAAASGGALFLDELAGECAPPMAAVEGIGGAVVFGGDNGEYGFVERKRPRVAAGLLEDQRAVLAHAMAAPLQGILPFGDVAGRAACAGAASTSGRRMDGAGGISQGLLSQLYHHGVEIDALVRLEVWEEGFSVNRGLPCLCLVSGV
jgi:E3 ubiquitin-protein ligase BOI-like protein